MVESGACRNKKCDAYLLCAAKKERELLLGLRFDGGELDGLLATGIFALVLINVVTILFCIRSSDDDEEWRQRDVALCFEVNRNLARLPVQAIRWSTQLAFMASIVAACMISLSRGTLFVLVLDYDVICTIAGHSSNSAPT